MTIIPRIIKDRKEYFEWSNNKNNIPTRKVGIFLNTYQLKIDLQVNLKELSFTQENKPKTNIKNETTCN